MRRPGPLFICLNLQRAFLDPASEVFVPRGAHALLHARSCLAWARERELSVLHAFTTFGPGPCNAPIAGFEPKPSETIIYKRTASLFGSVEIERASVELRDAFLVGFTGARDCVATAVDAERIGARLVFVTDAIASPAFGEMDPSMSDTITASILGQFGGRIATMDLVWRSGGQGLPSTGVAR
jgi:hypothetical protein